MASPEIGARARKRVSMVVWNTFQNDARVRNEAATLARAGYHVVVVALHAPGVTSRSEMLEPGLEVWRVGKSQGRRLLHLGKRPRRRKPSYLTMIGLMLSRIGTHLAALNQLVRSRPHVVHAHDVNVLPTGWLAARLSGAKLVYDAHEISAGREGYESARRLVVAVERWFMPLAAATITTTGMRARFFARAYRVPRPLVLQNRPRLQQPQPTQKLREVLELSEPWPIVLYQGGLQPGRGLEDLVEAAGHVPNAYFVLIGGGSSEPLLRRLVDEFRLADRVRFIAAVPQLELSAYTAAADVGVQPIRNTCINHWSTDSNKLFEYAMAGLPVLASDFPEIRRIVCRYGLGELFDPERLGALANALNRLVAAPELRKRYARNAALHREALSWESQESLLVELYERIAPGPVRHHS